MTVRLGVVGLGRGKMLAEAMARVPGGQVVAVCDADADKAAAVGGELGVAVCPDLAGLLARDDVDAVLLANAFHQHAPAAVAALDAGKHVLSETAACFTVSEGVELVRAVERSGLVYALAENYAFLPFAVEMRRLYQAGELGHLQYAEAEYVHPIDPGLWTQLAPDPDHWRNWLPLLYYCTHALAPVVTATGLRPVAVSGFAVAFDSDDPMLRDTPRRADPAGVLMVGLEDGSHVRLLQGTLRGESVSVRLHGSAGAVENLRTARDDVWLRREAYDTSDGIAVDRVYRAPGAGGEGHDDADALVLRQFCAAVAGEEPPLVDVHQAVAMSLCGTLGFRSALSGSVRLELPDLRDEKVRREGERDDWAPGPEQPAPGKPWPSVRGDLRKC